jgi:glycine/D-amino acid oxidase-like deaminating enzyme
VDTKIDLRDSGPQADWQTAVLQAGQAWLRETVTRQRIDCDWQDLGHYKTATTPRGAQELDVLLARLEAKGLRHRRLSPAQAEAEIGTPHVTGAAWFPYCALVQPAGLIRGLLDTLPPCVELCTASPVQRLEPGKPHTLHCGPHRIQADTVILCTNVTLPHFGHGADRQLTVYTYAGMTPELDEGELLQLGQEPVWGATPVERLGPTTRKLGSRRFLFRAGFSYRKETSPAAIRTLLESQYAQRYPRMKAHRFESVWGGALSMTRNGAPIFGPVAPGVYALSACNASGIVKMSALGKLLAEAIAGQDSPLLRDTRHFARPSWMPPEPLRSMGVYFSLARMKRAMRGQ